MKKVPVTQDAGRIIAELLAINAELVVACEASEQCLTDLIDVYTRGCSMVVLDEAVRSCRDDALRRVQAAIRKARGD